MINAIMTTIALVVAHPDWLRSVVDTITQSK